MTGALIAFEGLDQSGKETQVRRLSDRLERAGHQVVALTFPCYQTEIAHEIKRALDGARDYAPDVLQLLFIANRYEYRTLISSWIADGHIVLCDRYLASSIAYGEAQGLDPGWLAATQRLLPAPALTILIDIAPETAVARKASGRDRFERDVALLRRVRASYLRQASADQTWIHIDGERPIDVVAAEIHDVVDARVLGHQ